MVAQSQRAHERGSDATRIGSCHEGWLRGERLDVIEDGRGGESFGRDFATRLHPAQPVRLTGRLWRPRELAGRPVQQRAGDTTGEAGGRKGKQKRRGGQGEGEGAEPSMIAKQKSSSRAIKPYCVSKDYSLGIRQHSSCEVKDEGVREGKYTRL